MIFRSPSRQVYNRLLHAYNSQRSYNLNYLSRQESNIVNMKVLFAVSAAIVTFSTSTYYAHSKKIPPVDPSGLGNLYMWGNNSDKIIPGAEEDNVNTPKRIPFFDNSTIKSCSVAQKHVAVVNHEGKVFRWGSIEGRPFEQPTQWTSGYVSQVACGESHVVAMSQDGKVFVLSNSIDEYKNSAKGWLGSSNLNGVEIHLPANLKKEKVIKISAGLNHVIALTDKGNVLSFSLDLTKVTKGQLGVEPEDMTKVPNSWNHVKFTHQVIDIGCGNDHSIVLTDKGKVYGFGSNAWGQLAQGPYENKKIVFSTPVEMTLSDKGDMVIKKIAAGGNNSIVIAESETRSGIYSVGHGLYGQLGNGKSNHMVGDFVKITELSDRYYFDEMANKLTPIRINHVSIGESHVAAVLGTLYPGYPSGDSVYTWGLNKSYQLHTGNRAISHSPIPARHLELKVDEVDEAETNLQLTHLDGKFKQSIICGNEVTAVYTKER